MTSGSARDPALPDGEILASALRRAVAATVDLAMIGLPVLLGAVEMLHGGDRLSDADALVLGVMASVMTVVYHTAGVALTGRTVGKALMSCRVVRSDTGGRVTWSHAAIRALVVAVGLALPALVLPALAVIFGAAVFDRWRRGLHDRAAGTIVVLD